jgi:hypothetical protein
MGQIRHEGVPGFQNTGHYEHNTLLINYIDSSNDSADTCLVQVVTSLAAWPKGWNKWVSQGTIPQEMPILYLKSRD